MKRIVLVGLLSVVLIILAACGGNDAEPTPEKTPAPTATFTAAPTKEVALPLVESGAAATDTPAAEAQSPIATPTAPPSPVEEPTATTEPTAAPTPGFESQAPVLVLAAESGVRRTVQHTGSRRRRLGDLRPVYR